MSYMVKHNLSIQTAQAKKGKEYKQIWDCLQAKAPGYLFSVPARRSAFPEILEPFMPQLVVCRNHVQCGSSHYCVSEVIALLKGELTISGVSPDKMPGTKTVEEKIRKFRKMPADSLKRLDGFWFDHIDTVGTLVVIPSGHIFTLCSDDGFFLRWGFGCQEKQDISRALKMIEGITNIFPELHTEDYATFKTWCEKAISTGLHNK